MASDVVIVGAGIAGLAAAYELQTRGVPFLVVDAASRAGGVILTEEIDGFTIDAGPDSLLVQKHHAIALCEALGLGPRLISTTPPRIAYVQRAGRLHRLPAASVLGIPTRFGPLVRSDLFSWSGKLRMAAEWFVPAKRDGRDESIGAFMTRRFGREASTYLADPLLAGIHAGDVDRLSVGALFPRFVEAERAHGSLLRAFRLPAGSPAAHPAPAERPDPAAGGVAHGEGAFRSLPGGLGELVRALVAKLPASSIRLRTPVNRVTIAADALRVDTPAEAMSARAVVIAAPAYVTASLVKDLDADLARLCAEIAYTSVAIVALAFDRSAIVDPLNGSGFVVPRAEGSPILAASWLSSKWPGRAPAGRALLRTFIGGARDPQALERSDDDLVRQSIGALTPIVGIRGAPQLTRVYRWPRANAQYEVGHLDRMAAIDGIVARHPGLFVTGSGFRGVGIPDCIADGRATARAAAEWLARDPSASRAWGTG